MFFVATPNYDSNECFFMNHNPPELNDEIVEHHNLD